MDKEIARQRKSTSSVGHNFSVQRDLRGGSEHRELRADLCQNTLDERPSHRPYLEYVEDISKNRSGGMKGHKLKPKFVQHHNNPTNPSICFVELFKFYQTVCPPNRPKNAFYIQPLQNPTPTCWFICKPVGHNKLEGTVARLCKLAGIPGYRINHSLRATAATRLYQAGNRRAASNGKDRSSKLGWSERLQTHFYASKRSTF